MKRNIKKKLNLELKQIRADLKKLKKSKKRMQLLWYRTKKERVALIKDLDQRLKAIRKGTSAEKTTRAKRAVGRTIGKKTRAKKSIMEPIRNKAPERKQIKKKNRKENAKEYDACEEEIDLHSRRHTVDVLGL